MAKKKKFDTQGKTIKQLADEYGIKPTIVYNRKYLAEKRGDVFDLEKALTTPVQKRTKRKIKVVNPTPRQPAIKLNPPDLDHPKKGKEQDGVFAGVLIILFIAFVIYFTVQHA